MKKRCFSMLFILCLSLNGCAQSTVRTKQEPITFNTPDRKTALQQFAYNSLPLVMNTQYNNCYSPVSFYVTLAMLASGTSDTVQEEILSTLQSDDSALLYEDMKLLIEQLQKNSYMNMTQSIWLQEDRQPADEWQNTLEKQFLASIHDVNFRKKGTSKDIEKWISKETKDLIHPTLEIKPDTILLLLNTIFLETKWQTPFPTKQTYDETFYLEDTSTKQVPFMHHEIESTPYFNHPTYSAIRLPLSDGSYLYFFLPNEPYQLDDLLQEDWLADIQNEEYVTRKVKLSIPKFQYDSNIDLIQACKDMGVQQVFYDPIMKLDPPASLLVYQAEQNAHIELDEKGVKAAAETHIAMEDTAMRIEEQLRITFNRPFLYVLTTIDQIPLFMGTVMNPLNTTR